MKSFLLTPLAASDLNEIWEYLATDNIESADRTLMDLEKAMQRPARRPHTGHVREDLANRQHRFLLVSSYLIVYRAETKPLQVIRVLHTARDVQQLLGSTIEKG
ncbi:MAG: type II toxin-antitoxin system RelE/ParE family toxin [Acidobacteriia bacterium]|nr:type II toxin-antitoxin system RelE/ParE family toxin [Terriglobia bacterium]